MRIVVVSASFGAGHDGVAAELARRFTAQGCVVDRHDFVDLLPRHLGAGLRGAYRRQLMAAPRTWGWFLALTNRASWLGAAARLTGLADEAMLAAVGDADLVVSTYPLASQVLGRLRRQGRLGAPVATYLTDLSVHPLWIADGVDLHLALHQDAAGQAHAHGADRVRVVAPVVRPDFEAAWPGVAPAEDQALSRRRWDLPAKAPLALIVAGAWGVGAVEQACADVAAAGIAVPVVVCGRNDALRRRLAHRAHGVALGWVEDMAGLVRTCQVVIQNAGGLTSLEALTSGTPVLTYRCLPGHGRTNAEVLDRIGWVPWIRQSADLAVGLRHALATRPAFRPAGVPATAVLAELGATRPRAVATVPTVETSTVAPAHTLA